MLECSGWRIECQLTAGSPCGSLTFARIERSRAFCRDLDSRCLSSQGEWETSFGTEWTENSTERH